MQILVKLHILIIILDMIYISYMWIYPSFFQLNFFLFVGEGRHNPFTWFYNNYHCLYTSQVLSTSFSRQGESCVGDITALPTSKNPTTIRQQNISCNNNNPKRRLLNKSLIRKWFMTANRPAFLHVVHSYCHYQWAR